MNDLKDLQKRGQEILQLYSQSNSKNGHDKWNGKEYALGFVGDVGDLAKIIMAKENLREMDNVDARLAHELSDCLWSVFVLAAHYKVDVEKEFLKTMDELESRISGDRE